MGIDRHKLDDLAFVAALGAIGFAGLAFVARANGAALVMCAILFAGLLAGRMAGVSGRALLGVAAGLVVILWVAWIDPLSTPRRTSAFTHFWGGLLVGLALSATLRRRMAWPRWGVYAMVAILAITIGWEICELLGDRLLDTALVPDWRDSADDIRFGTFAGAIAIGLARWFDPARRAPRT